MINWYFEGREMDLLYNLYFFSVQLCLNEL